jgi:DNA-directed RNA polymerase subunit M/transcription elongation factor TFIIS
MYVISKPIEFREKMVNKLTQLFIDQSEFKYNGNNIDKSLVLHSEPHSEPYSKITTQIDKKIPINLEKGIYNYSIKEATNQKIIKKWSNKYFVQIYLNHFKSIYINLKTTPQLFQQLISGELQPNILAFMNHQEMRPDQWEELIQKKIKREELKYINRTEATTDIYQCRKCKSRKCTHYSVQIRSADEPMTVFVSCLSCGKNWKN